MRNDYFLLDERGGKLFNGMTMDFALSMELFILKQGIMKFFLQMLGLLVILLGNGMYFFQYLFPIFADFFQLFTVQNLIPLILSNPFVQFIYVLISVLFCI